MSTVGERNVVLAYWYLKRRRKYRRHWVHPYIRRNVNRRAFVAAKELEKDDEKFKCFYRMSKELFQWLTEELRPVLQRKDTNYRPSISVEERLLITLRYLGSGSSFSSLSYYFARGNCTIGRIVHECCTVIWTELHERYMPVPDSARWKAISQRFGTLWNLPNCVGSLDGKHVRIRKTPDSGSRNYNYKSFHSVVLLAIADADGNFIMIETGYSGQNSDGGIFRVSRMNHWLNQGMLDLPELQRLPHDENICNFPFYFTADEAFPLTKNLMRPYPKRRLNDRTIIFNYRLSRGRKSVECAFGMMSQKFQVLLNSITCKHEQSVNAIVKAVCVLHNLIRKTEGQSYTITYAETANDYDCQQARDEREIATIDHASNAQKVRDYLSYYFLKPNVALPWQGNHCVDK